MSLCNLVFFQASVGILAPAISTYVNERAPEEQRATILSFQTGLFSDRTLQRGDDSSVSTLWSGGLACGVYDRLRVVFRSAERR